MQAHSQPGPCTQPLLPLIPLLSLMLQLLCLPLVSLTFVFSSQDTPSH